MLLRLIIALEALFTFVAPAHADPISIAVLSFIGIDAIAGSAIVAVTTFVIEAAVSIGLSYLAKALMPKPRQPDITQQPGGTTGKLQTGGTVPRSFIVGRAMTAGSLAYGNTYSSGAAISAADVLAASLISPLNPTIGFVTLAAGNTPNAYLVQVVALSDLPIHGLAGMFVNDAAVTYNPAATAAFEGIPIPEYNVGGTDYLWVRFYDGTQTEADPALVQLFSSDPDRPYAASRVGQGIAYAVVTARVNQDLFPGFPQCKFILDGVPLYDRRFDTSAGGSGSQDAADNSTWAVTRNPIVVIENILRGISYGGKWLFGAQTVANGQLPFSSWTAAASECDSPITLASGDTEPQYSVGGEIRFDTQPVDAIDELLKACNGRLAEIGGTYKIRAGAPGSAVMSFTDADILSTEQQTFDPFLSLGQVVNAVTAKYISPAEGWVAKDAPPLYDDTLETQDGGRRQAVDVNYSFVTSGTQVQRLMKSERDTRRAMRKHTLPLPPDAFVLEPLDVVSWTSTRNGYSSKTFEVLTADDLPNLNVGVLIDELDPNAYDWVGSSDEQPIIDGTINIVNIPAQPIVDWSAEPYTLVADDGTQLPAIELLWNPHTDDVNGIRYEVRLNSSHEVISTGESDRVSVGALIISQSLLGKTVYQVRGQYRPASSRPVTWSSWITVTTPDVKVTVDDLEAALKLKVTTEFNDIIARADKTAGLIASIAAEQDAANWIDKVNVKANVQETKVVLQSSIDGANATIQSVSDAVTSTQGSLATLTTSVSVQFGAITATVNQNTTALASANVAFSSFQTSTQASLNSLTAQTNATQTSFTTLNSAFGSFQTSTTATLGSLSSSVTTNSTAVATISGKLAAQWLVTLDVNGYVSGIKSYNDGSTSQFIIITDDFLVAKPGVGGGSPVPVFAISSVNGATKVAFRGDMYADGTVNARAFVAKTITAASGVIGDLAVDSLQVAGQAITAPIIVQDNAPLVGTGAVQTAISGAINVFLNGLPNGTPYLVKVTGRLEWTATGTSGINVWLYIDGSPVESSSQSTFFSFDYAVSGVWNGSLITHVGQLLWQASNTITAQTRILTLQVFKR